MSGEGASVDISVSNKSASRADSDSERSNRGHQGDNVIVLDVAKSIKSSCTAKAVNSFSSVLRMLDGYSVKHPEPDEWVCYPSENEVGVYMKNFDQGLCLPLHPFIVELLCFLQVTILQLFPSLIFIIMAFLFLCGKHIVSLSVNLFRYLFTKKDKTGSGWITIYARHAWILIIGFPSSIKE